MEYLYKKSAFELYIYGLKKFNENVVRHILKILDICKDIIDNLLILWVIRMFVVHFEQFRIIYIYIFLCIWLLSYEPFTFWFEKFIT